MNSKIAIEILKQASLETTTGACENCPRKDKNKTCIGCLDEAKECVLLEIDRLNNVIHKAIEYIEIETENINNLIVVSEDFDIEKVLDILKGVDKE